MDGKRWRDVDMFGLIEADVRIWKHEIHRIKLNDIFQQKMSPIVLR